MLHDEPAFWRDKAQRFREAAEMTDSQVLAAALRSRAKELDELAARIEAGGGVPPSRAARSLT